MALTITQLAAELRIGDGRIVPDEPIFSILSRAYAVSAAIVHKYAPSAPEDVLDSASIRICAYLYNSDPAGGRNLYTNAITSSGAAGLLDLWKGTKLILADGTEVTDDEQVIELAEIMAEIRNHNNSISSHPHILGLIELANQATTAAILAHNTTPLSHQYLINEIHALQQAINMLGGDVADVNLAKIRVRGATFGGFNDRVKLQWSTDTGTTWMEEADAELLALALASHAHDWPDDDIPFGQIAANDPVNGQFLRAVQNGNSFSARWESLPGFIASSFGNFDPTPDNVNILRFGGLFFKIPDDANENGEIWYRQANAFQKIAEFIRVGGGGGTPGSGVTEARVLALISQNVQSQARVGNTTPWGASKLLASGNTNGYLVFTNGNNLFGRVVANWVWDAGVRIPGGKYGASWADETIMFTTSNVPTWRTFAQAVEHLKPALFSLLANNSAQITDPGDGSLVIAGATPTAANLLTRFKADQVEVDGDDSTKLNIIFPSGLTSTSHVFQWIRNPASRNGLFAQWVADWTSQGGYQLRAVPTYITSSGQSTELVNAYDFTDDLADDARFAGSAGVSDYDDLTNKPFLRENPHTSEDEDHLLVYNEGGTPTIYQPHTTPATNPEFTARAYNVSDLPAGATLGDDVDEYIDLPVGVAEERRFVRSEVRVFKYLPDQLRWIDDHEDIFQTQGGYRWFSTKAIAEAALGAHYHNDDDANGVHICYGSPRALYTITDFTAGVARETVHKPYGSEVMERVGVNSSRITHVEQDILAGKTLWFGTSDEYDALSTEEKESTSRVHFRARP